MKKNDILILITSVIFFVLVAFYMEKRRVRLETERIKDQSEFNYSEYIKWRPKMENMKVDEIIGNESGIKLIP